jgi:hypothetical protein
MPRLRRFHGARLCAKHQPQHVHIHKALEIFHPASAIHALRLVLRTQSHSVAESRTD